MNILEHVRDNQRVHFDFYRDGILYYKTDSGLIFEIPISDTKGGVFLRDDKALNFMRWIRPQLEKNEAAMKEMG
jgi:hypothetical protein